MHLTLVSELFSDLFIFVGDEAPWRASSVVEVETCAGQVAVRASGSFNIQTASGVVQGIGFRYCRLIQRTMSYDY